MNVYYNKYKSLWNITNINKTYIISINITSARVNYWHHNIIYSIDVCKL